MTSDIRTALEIIKDETETNIVNAFVKMKTTELIHQPVNSCTMEKPCVKCKCLWCTLELSFSAGTKPLHIKLHNECYYKVIKEWVP